MQLANFEIDSGFTTLLYNGNHLDLHNNFYFVLLDHSMDSGIAQITFNKGTGEWVPEKSPDKLTLVFRNVTQIFRKEEDSDYPTDYLQKDANTIDIIGFSYGDDEIMDGVTNNMPNKDLTALLFVFVTGRSIKIVADSVELYVEHL